MKTQLDNTQEEQSTIAQSVQKEPSTGGTATIVDNRPSTVYQRKLRETMDSHRNSKKPLQRKANKTGLPDTLKSGIENLSGYSMNDVKVHYNSSKPAQLQAHAYAQGADIHLAPGQQKHLPHEAWHVVQQKQGRVKPTRQLKSKVNINDDAGLEKEADVMGAKASKNGQGFREDSTNNGIKQSPVAHSKTIQAKFTYNGTEMKSRPDFTAWWSKLNLNDKKSLEQYKGKIRGYATTKLADIRVNDSEELIELIEYYSSISGGKKMAANGVLGAVLVNPENPGKFYGITNAHVAHPKEFELVAFNKANDFEDEAEDWKLLEVKEEYKDKVKSGINSREHWRDKSLAKNTPEIDQKFSAFEKGEVKEKIQVQGTPLGRKELKFKTGVPVDLNIGMTCILLGPNGQWEMEVIAQRGNLFGLVPVELKNRLKDSGSQKEWNDLMQLPTASGTSGSIYAYDTGDGYEPTALHKGKTDTWDEGVKELLIKKGYMEEGSEIKPKMCVAFALKNVLEKILADEKVKGKGIKTLSLLT